MKLLWCWRCRAEVPMLDDDEFHCVTGLLYKGQGATVQQRMFSAVLSEHQRVTGFARPIPTRFGTTGFRFMVGHARDAASPSALLGQNYADPAWNRFINEMTEGSAHQNKRPPVSRKPLPF
jgi:hypothetical protein